MSISSMNHETTMVDEDCPKCGEGSLVNVEDGEGILSTSCNHCKHEFHPGMSRHGRNENLAGNKQLDPHTESLEYLTQRAREHGTPESRLSGTFDAETGEGRKVAMPPPEYNSTQSALSQPTYFSTPMNSKTGFTRGNPMDLAWRLLKELTPEQETQIQDMYSRGMGAYAEELRAGYEQENAFRQEQKPQMTPEIQSRYQDPLDNIKAQKDSKAAIRRAKKDGERKRYNQLKRQHISKYGETRGI